MHFCFAVVAAFLFADGFATPIASPRHLVHEKRDKTPQGWTQQGALDPHFVLPMRIGLAQRNLDRAHDFILDVADPKSKNYGKHWSAKQVAETFAPSKDSVVAVKDWLSLHGIQDERVTMSQGMNWIHFNATVAEAEKMLKTKYYAYGHDRTGIPHVACDEYSIPEQISKHVDIITPTVHFDRKIKPHSASAAHIDKIREERDAKGDLPAHRSGLGWKKASEMTRARKPVSDPPVQSLDVDGVAMAGDLSDCANNITPDCLRALYSFSANNNCTAPGNSFGIVEYTPQAFSTQDLQQFFASYNLPAVGAMPVFQSIDGGFLQDKDLIIDNYLESSLDLEYGMAITFPQTVTLYQVGDYYESGSFNDFLDALDETYCSGGFDTPYPDPTCDEGDYGCYKGSNTCGGFSATKVISTSYGTNEHDLTDAYAIRQCNEYMKLGLQGVTIVYSSGDSGVAGNGGACIDDGSGVDGFNPGFPSTCPFITSVGATQLISGADIANLASDEQPEEVCTTVITSGGGFSNLFNMPNYQQGSLSSWWQTSSSNYSSYNFNKSQKTRAYPDIAANGAFYVIQALNETTNAFGTSASAPTVGGIFTLVNQERLNAGKSPIGFVNPVLYAHPEMMKDVTQGSNPGCGTDGFSAVPGWDPATGLGTPMFPEMKKVWMNLP